MPSSDLIQAMLVVEQHIRKSKYNRWVPVSVFRVLGLSASILSAALNYCQDQGETIKLTQACLSLQHQHTLWLLQMPLEA